MQDRLVLKVLQVSQDQWDHLDLLERVVLDILDHKAHQDLLVTLIQVNLAPQVALENQAALVSQVIEVLLVQLDRWVPEVHQEHLEPLGQLGFLLLENLDHLESMGQLDHEESLA